MAKQKRFNPNDYVTSRERVLEALATRLLRKAKYFPRKERITDEYQPVEADCISANSRLRSPVQGRA